MVKNAPAGGKDREFNLEISRLKDEGRKDPYSLPGPQTSAGDAIAKLNACLDEPQEILNLIDAEELE